VRERHDLLMDADGPAGGRWNRDHDNREPPRGPKVLGVGGPWRPEEDEITRSPTTLTGGSATATSVSSDGTASGSSAPRAAKPSRHCAVSWAPARGLRTFRGRDGGR
jgi:hypothetical protein